MREALEATLTTIEKRARLYRRTVMVVAGIVVVSAVSAAVWRSWLPLAGLILLVPATGGFFVLDGLVTFRWGVTILDLWTLQNLNVTVLAKSFAGSPVVPAQTIQAMFATLPQNVTDSRPVAVSQEQRTVALRILQKDIRRQLFHTIAGCSLFTAALCFLAVHPSRLSILLVVAVASALAFRGYGRRK